MRLAKETIRSGFLNIDNQFRKNFYVTDFLYTAVLTETPGTLK
jgi:multisubunit Na+/H+ antiporter MnhE subunit